ncbi:MAG: cell division protein SepF [Nakamurella sp.]
MQGSLAVQPEVRLETPAEITGSSQKPATITLTGFADARDVGETYRKGQAVILDMTDLTDAEARRMVDFAAGLAFAVRGSIDKVTTKVFMLHPPESAVSAESDELTFASR